MTYAEYQARTRRRARADTSGATVDGIQAQVALQELAIEGLRHRQQREQERQMATETSRDVERELAQAADAFRRADPSLSAERAVVLALEQDGGTLYERHCAAIAREQSGTALAVEPDAAHDLTTARNAAALELAIHDEREANPTLTREQAYARALDKYPALYEGL